MKVSPIFAAALALFLVIPAAADEEARLLRFPDIHEDTIAFSYAGDLWVVSDTGGIARRITTHPGLEMMPKFSPGGDSIAFTGQYDGNANVYVIPAQGGPQEQLTWWPEAHPMPARFGPSNQVI
ncbi:protease, partial [Thermodesulfobacteriota bacterium]